MLYHIRYLVAKHEEKQTFVIVTQNSNFSRCFWDNVGGTFSIKMNLHNLGMALHVFRDQVAYFRNCR